MCPACVVARKKKRFSVLSFLFLQTRLMLRRGSRSPPALPASGALSIASISLWWLNVVGTLGDAGTVPHRQLHPEVPEERAVLCHPPPPVGSSEPRSNTQTLRLRAVSPWALAAQGHPHSPAGLFRAHRPLGQNLSPSPPPHSSMPFPRAPLSPQRAEISAASALP